MDDIDWAAIFDSVAGGGGGAGAADVAPVSQVSPYPESVGGGANDPGASPWLGNFFGIPNQPYSGGQTTNSTGVTPPQNPFDTIASDTQLGTAGQSGQFGGGASGGQSVNYGTSPASGVAIGQALQPQLSC